VTLATHQKARTRHQEWPVRAFAAFVGSTLPRARQQGVGFATLLCRAGGGGDLAWTR
jgi:hypothetical protein